ncbi:hypothetical protein ACRAWF_24740 [Streptomyces sp. L7]
MRDAVEFNRFDPVDVPWRNGGMELILRAERQADATLQVPRLRVRGSRRICCRLVGHGVLAASITAYEC